jgi:hypothetical protein
VGRRIASWWYSFATFSASPVDVCINQWRDFSAHDLNEKRVSLELLAPIATLSRVERE